MNTAKSIFSEERGVKAIFIVANTRVLGPYHDILARPFSSNPPLKELIYVDR